MIQCGMWLDICTYVPCPMSDIAELILLVSNGNGQSWGGSEKHQESICVYVFMWVSWIGLSVTTTGFRNILTFSYLGVTPLDIPIAVAICRNAPLSKGLFCWIWACSQQHFQLRPAAAGVVCNHRCKRLDSQCPELDIKLYGYWRLGQMSIPTMNHEIMTFTNQVQMCTTKRYEDLLNKKCSACTQRAVT